MSALGLVIIVAFSISLFIMLAGVKERLGLKFAIIGAVFIICDLIFKWAIGMSLKEVALIQGSLRASMGVVFGSVMLLTGVLLMVKEMLFARSK